MMRMQMRSVLPLLAVTLLSCAAMAAAQSLGGPEVRGPEARGADPRVTSWAGRLVDCDCTAAKPAEPCDAFAGTASFGLVTNTGASYKLDSKGNQLARNIMKDYKKRGAVKANATAKADGDTLIVETLSIPE